jgi:phosphoribosylaminoimidazole (AIR) synthetase
MPPLTCKKAGADIDNADTFIKAIKSLLEKRKRPEVLGRIGGFSWLFMPRLSASIFLDIAFIPDSSFGNHVFFPLKKIWFQFIKG